MIQKLLCWLLGHKTVSARKRFLKTLRLFNERRLHFQPLIGGRTGVIVGSSVDGARVGEMIGSPKCPNCGQSLRRFPATCANPECPTPEEIEADNQGKVTRWSKIRKEVQI